MLKYEIIGLSCVYKVNFVLSMSSDMSPYLTMVSKLQCYLDRTVQGAVKFWIRVAFFFIQGPGLGWIRIFGMQGQGQCPVCP